jgi:hypothetical protein
MSVYIFTLFRRFMHVYGLGPRADFHPEATGSTLETFRVAVYLRKVASRLVLIHPRLEDLLVS